MKTVWILLIAVGLGLAACQPIRPVPVEVAPALGAGQFESPLLLQADPFVQPLSEPEIDYWQWNWFKGEQIIYEYDPLSYPQWLVRMSIPYFFVNCKDMQFKFDDSHYSWITVGYWEIYDPRYGTLSGSKYFRLSNGWIKGKIDQLEDVMNPTRYVAQCKRY